MSTRLENTPLDFDGHPDENQLLLALERELSPEEVAKVDRHLGSCWDCRARSHELSRGILAFVEYREKRYLPSLDSPPHDFGDFRRQLRIAAGEVRQDGILSRIWGRFSARFSAPAPVRWAVTAALMVLVLIWTQVLSPTKLSANELLTRAQAFQNPRVPRAAGRVVRRAYQKVRISDGQGSAVVRDFEWNIGSEIVPAHWGQPSNPSLWSAPLTAEGFASWRDSVSRPVDEVIRSGDLWTLDTTAVGDSVRKAWIVIRADDYHPVEQHIRFADGRQLDFAELSFEIRSPQTVRSGDTTQQVAQNATPNVPVAGPDTPVNLNEPELAVRYLMFSNQWDLDEDLQITRSLSQVVVEGTASSPDRSAVMQAALTALPNVRAAINAPGGGPRPGVLPPAPVKTVSAAAVPLLRTILERSFASNDARQAFVDRSLNASDVALSHAWVLKRLVDRYTEEEEAALTPESRTKLRQMLQAHVQQLRSANAELEQLIELLAASPVQDPNPANSWRAAIVSLFNAIQQQDSLVAALIAGTQTSGLDVSAASQNLRTAHNTIHGLIRALEEGASALK